MDDSIPQQPGPSAYGKRLRIAMALDGWMPVRLASELGISKAAVGKVLNGGSIALSAENHVKAARLLRVDPYWLALGEGEPRPQPVAMRDLNGAEWQLVTFFRGLPTEAQDRLLDEAASLYGQYNPPLS